MKLSTRSRYGIRAALELALEYGKGPLQVKTVAQREGISSKYLEQLVASLKSAGLVRSVRGPKGGYLLTRSPQDISLKDIFTALEGPLIAVECLEHPEYCSRCTDCIARGVWQEMQNAINSVLESRTLEDLVVEARNKSSIDNYQI